MTKEYIFFLFPTQHLCAVSVSRLENGANIFYKMSSISSQKQPSYLVAGYILLAAIILVNSDLPFPFMPRENRPDMQRCRGRQGCSVPGVAAVVWWVCSFHLRKSRWGGTDQS